ncbi:MAG: aminotransferase class V-fold PLP-dependent enzyme [Chitinophagaceae bacterium]|nr:aminotransferase class V-fold PLP-dependent enzyme [Chitinophagaceae bacterium]MBL0056219.1 aminotransferase class V-fold PLP-dependent enzyme [Chitinophagaceae bacterium]
MANRRSFLNKLGLLSATAITANLFQPAWSRDLQYALDGALGTDPAELASDEDFWYYIQQSYTISSNFINLNNGGVAPAPKTVADAMKRYYDISNEAPSYFMWRIIDQGREPLRKNLAQLAGCEAEELALLRNASEALETVIFGIELKAGDEVVLAKQDYPNMIGAWKQREKREGIKLVWINLDLPSEDVDYMVSQYTNAFTQRTKLVQVTHMINWIGQKLPVRKIADAAKQRGIDVLVDGAHTFAQFEFKLPDLNCDYFGTSLHKWLGAPIGTGFLYVRKEKIKQVWPLFGAGEKEEENIRKFEHLGTRPFFIEEAIDKAIDFYEMIGAKRKEERLLYLKNYWMSRVKDLPGVRLHTSMKKEFGCAIGLVSVDGKTPGELDSFLWDQYKIHSVGINWENIHGVRITPNVYTTTKNLDRLVEAIGRFAKS